MATDTSVRRGRVHHKRLRNDLPGGHPAHRTPQVLHMHLGQCVGQGRKRVEQDVQGRVICGP